MTKKRILVTGATGYIGNEVINCLVKRKQFTIIASDINYDKAKAYPWFKSVKFIEYNLKSKSDDLYSLFLKPDIIIHLSWAGLPNYNKLFHIEENLIDNIIFLKNLAETGIKRIVVAGTCLEYGLTNGALAETHVTNPITPYSVAKDSLRRYLELLAAEYKIDYRWVRIFYILSNRTDQRGVISQLATAINNGEKTFNLSGGEQLRDFLPITDIASTLVMVAMQNEENGIFNCCSGEPVSVKTLVQDYVEQHKSNIKLNFGYYPYLNYEPMAYWGDRTKIEKVSKRFKKKNKPLEL